MFLKNEPVPLCIGIYSNTTYQLVDFIPHGNTQIRHIAVESLVGYAISHTSSFKKNQLLPVRNLMLLVRDYEKIAKNSLVILINLSTDAQVRDFIASDEEFLKVLIGKLINTSEPHTDEISSLLSNLGKQDDFKRALLTEKFSVKKGAGSLGKTIDQLLDLFVKNTEIINNLNLNYDHLSYLFADIAMLSEGRKYMLTKQDHDGIIPITKLIVFTSHNSNVRRRGVASTIKNLCFETERHENLIDCCEDGIGLLPFLLLPLMGHEEYDEEDSEGMLEECQLLPSDKEREPDTEILRMHLESLLLLTTTRLCRDQLRKIKVYPIIRELHLATMDGDVKDTCDRLVQVLMRDEEH
ncbi:Protein HGH1-like protein [Golovinomyces cichoracearum]|uniref:Protein HGH1 homolog n=1 Tax=Golovinomyces cichoracearum TaxID=62708 RepID=A0A420I9F6_9PEZI|nr:Protein HGH1-like protein [Golovinomyces cichoracearum]